VESVLHREHAVALLASSGCVLECNLDRAIVGLGAAVREEHALEPVAHDSGNLPASDDVSRL
jgi:hypothetical protein